MNWQKFLQKQAENYNLSEQLKETLLKRFPEKDRYIKKEAQFTELLNEGISESKYRIGQDAVTKRMQEIYQTFEKNCPELQKKSPGKLLILYNFLIDQYNKTNTKNRCILGLKGHYQEAQQKLTEITEHLQNLLKDKTLSITKVEAGSILLILESSQTGYEQLKRLIGQEIAGFPVEYAIDEWQDVCRRMLLDRKLLTSNTVLGRASGNRDLIDEDLFVDLALVKPKRSQNEKHPQDIDPEKGSDFFVRQEVEKRFAYREFLQEIIGNRTEKKIAIIGEPGAGKTTLLQKLAFWLLQSTDDLVIWVDLAELGDRDLGEYLEEKWLKQALGKSREEIKADWEQKFKGGAVWLLLDGFDEMSQSDQDALKFRGWVMDAQIIVTCRLNLWQANPTQLQAFQTYLTQPFQDEQMQEFIGRLFRGLVEAGEDVQLAESLWSDLQTTGKERIKDLCRNPLRLTLLCSIWQGRKGNLPDTTAKLYEKFVNYIYKWKKKEFPLTEKEREKLNAALGELAKASLDREGTKFRLTYPLVCEYLGQPDDNSLLDMALKLGWLNEVGVDADEPEYPVYGFYHGTFQEYFAACSIDKPKFFLDNIDPKKWKGFLPRSYRIFEKHWKNVFLLWLGNTQTRKSKKEKLIKNLLTFQDNCSGFYHYRAFLLAAEGIAEFPDSQFADEIICLLIKLSFGERLNIYNSQNIHIVYGYSQTFKSSSEITLNIFWFAIKESAAKTLLKTNKIRVVELLINYIERIVIADYLINCDFELDIDPSIIKSQIGAYLYLYRISILTDIIETLLKFLIALKPYFDLLDTKVTNLEEFYNEILDLFIKTNFLENRVILALSFLSQLGYQNFKELLSVQYTQKLLNNQNELIRIRAASVLQELKILEEIAEHCKPDNKFEVMFKITELKSRRLTTLELRNEKRNGSSMIELLIQELQTKKHDPQIKLFMEMVIFNVKFVKNICLSDIDTNVYELRKYFKKILSLENFRILKLDSWPKTKIILENSEKLGFSQEEIVYWMSNILRLNTPMTNEKFLDIWEFFPSLNATLWYCSQNLTYPQFYQAWHHPPTTPHPEVTEQTPHSSE
ncbi:MAG: NACHT domain-containing NTPase [Trichodesmium sp.]